MSEIKKEVIKTFDGECVLTLRKVKHSKEGEMRDYLSLSDGLNATGIFLGPKTKEAIIKFLGGTNGRKK